MKVLMVDDSQERLNSVREKIKYIDGVDFQTCETADSARKVLGVNFDLLILDILIPKKIGQTPVSKNSIDLLSDICDPLNKKYLRPNLIIGLTADTSYIEKYAQSFKKNASVVLEASRESSDWLESIYEQIKSINSTKVKINEGKNKLIISIHGIRTYGHWQAQITESINSTSYEFSVEELKLGFVDILSFFIPKTRNSIIERKSNQLCKIINENKDKEINIISHSFGTCIVLHYFNNHCEDGFDYNCTILSGSPISSEEDISSIIKKSRITLNECGTKDFILILSKVFVLGLGDAGRVGFNRAVNDKFKNRFFDGGHSLYFQNHNDQSFYEKFWLSLIKDKLTAKNIDERKNFFLEDLFEFLLKTLERLKGYIYLFLGSLLIFFLYRFIT